MSEIAPTDSLVSSEDGAELSLDEDVWLPPLVNHAALGALRESASASSARLAAMYSSVLGGVVTDLAFMTVPIDDHLVHRGHAVFDTASLHGGRLYRLEVHLERFLAGAKAAKIEHDWSIDDLRRIIAGTVARSEMRDGSVRYWLGAGPGGFSFEPAECPGASFYCAVFRPVSFEAEVQDGPTAIGEVSVTDSPTKSPLLASIKSNNYLTNVLVHLEAAESGGRFGVMIDAEGFVAEGAVVNVAFVTADGRLVTPPFDRILRGTTIRRVLTLAQDLLVPEGLLSEVAQEPVAALSIRRNLSEMFVLGGDTHLWSVTSWDGHQVGDGEVGPVASRLFALLEAEARGAEIHPTSADQWTPVPYL